MIPFIIDGLIASMFLVFGIIYKSLSLITLSILTVGWIIYVFKRK